MSRPVLLVLLLLAVPAVGAEEEPRPDPLADLPGCLREASARFVRAAAEGELRATVEYGAAAAADGTVRLTLTSETAAAGPMTRRLELTADLSATDRRIVAFALSLAEGEGAKLRPVARTAPDPKKPDRLVLLRTTYDGKGEPTERATAFTPPEELWAPAPLEPFLAALLAPAGDEPAAIALVDPETGRSAGSATYRDLGAAKRRVGETEVECRILRREHRGATKLVYRRAADGMPVDDQAARLVLQPPPAPRSDAK